jgi:hypothetical protein
MTDVELLWREHLAADFPPGCRGRDVEGIGLILLDAGIAGCVQTFVELGELDPQRIAILGRCYRDAAVVVRALRDEDEHAHFTRLEHLAALTLEALSTRAPAA